MQCTSAHPPAIRNNGIVPCRDNGQGNPLPVRVGTNTGSVGRRRTSGPSAPATSPTPVAVGAAGRGQLRLE